MSLCGTCGSGEIRITRGASRRSFFQVCTNRRCRATVEVVLSIADAVAQLPRPESRRKKRAIDTTEDTLLLDAG